MQWLQNKRNEYWSEEEVNSKLRERMVSTFRNVKEISDSMNVSMRMASYIIALRN